MLFRAPQQDASKFLFGEGWGSVTCFDQLPASEDGMPTKKMHGKSSLMHLWCSGFRWKQDGCEVVCSVIFQINAGGLAGQFPMGLKALFCMAMFC